MYCSMTLNTKGLGPNFQAYKVFFQGYNSFIHIQHSYCLNQYGNNNNYKTLFIEDKGHKHIQWVYIDELLMHLLRETLILHRTLKMVTL